MCVRGSENKIDEVIVSVCRFNNYIEGFHFFSNILDILFFKHMAACILFTTLIILAYIRKNKIMFTVFVVSHPFSLQFPIRI